MRTVIHHITLCPGVVDGSALVFIPDACLQIADGIITYAGPAKQADTSFQADQQIDGEGCLAIPGLTNAHTHIAMTLLRGFGSGLNLQDWLEKKIFPAEDRLTAEFTRAGALLGMAEMLRFGVTACADMYFFMDEVAEAAAQTGMRASISRAVVGDAGNDGGRLAEAEDLVRAWHGAENGRIRVCLAPHAEYSSTPAMIRRIRDRAQALGVGIHVHMSETRYEVQECIKRHGVSPVRYFEEQGLLELPVLAAHCVAVDREDMEILARNKVWVCHNPVSNLKLASGVMPLPDMLRAGVPVCLGTDGVSSNNTLNLWEELRLTALLHKGVSGDPRAVSEAEAFGIATVAGAAAMGFEKVGYLAPGWHGDVVLLDQKGLHLCPNNDPAANLVFAQQGADVRMTLVDGVVRYRDGEWPGLDVEAIRTQAAHAAHVMTQGL